MKTSANRILTTHVGSMPRPENLVRLLRARLDGQMIEEAHIDACTELRYNQAAANLAWERTIAFFNEHLG